MDRGRPKLAYSTAYGHAYQGDSRHLLQSNEFVQPESVDLIITSPPFALTRKKEYGNESAERFVEWFLTFIKPFERVLKPTGSLVIDIGGAYLPGAPARSTYHFQLAVALDKEFPLCQEFYWYNPAKLPAPAEWVNVRRLRVKDSVNLVLWLAKDPARTKADNRRVLRRYSQSMNALLKNGYQYRVRPSGHDISDNFSKHNGGAIPPNLLGFATTSEDMLGEPFEASFENLVAISNTSSNDRYLRACKDHGIKPHPARFPVGLPAFFIEFLTEPGDLVVDPFGGSGTTGEAAEALKRRWVTCDLDEEGARSGTYVRASAFRFDNAQLTPEFDFIPDGSYSPPVQQAPPLS
jgi:DNA modification methylase